jgi:hypothetical protein
MATPAYQMSDDADTTAAQYAQIIRTRKAGKKDKQALRLYARLINQHGHELADRKIETALKSWDLLSPLEEDPKIKGATTVVVANIDDILGALDSQ